MERMIERVKFDSLEKKYSQLCAKHGKLTNRISNFEKWLKEEQFGGKNEKIMG